MHKIKRWQHIYIFSRKKFKKRWVEYIGELYDENRDKKKKDERRLETTEMKMLRRMLDVTLKDRMRNEDVRRRTTMTLSVVSVIEVNKLRWYGHMLRKSEDEVVRQAWEVPVKGERSRGCQPRRWSGGLRKRLEELSLKEEDAEDRKKWRSRIQAANP